MAEDGAYTYTGDGLRVRLRRIRGETHKDSLRRSLVLPAVLGDFEFTEESSHREYETVSMGEFSVPTGGRSIAARRLVDSDMESLTVGWDPVWLVAHNPGYTPQDIYEELRKLLRYRRAFELYVTTRWGREPELDINATLRSLGRTLRFGQPGIRYYRLTFKEWRDPQVARRSSGGESRAPGTRLPTTHKLDNDDTLNSLSKLYYGTYAGAAAIARHNAIRGWGKSTALVKTKRYKVGDKIKIPEKPREAIMANPPPTEAEAITAIPAPIVGE